MAGMARRGSHSARHRAGRPKSDVDGPDVSPSDGAGPDISDPDFYRQPGGDLPTPDWRGPVQAPPMLSQPAQAQPVLSSPAPSPSAPAPSAQPMPMVPELVQPSFHPRPVQPLPPRSPVGSPPEPVSSVGPATAETLPRVPGDYRPGPPPRGYPGQQTYPEPPSYQTQPALLDPPSYQVQQAPLDPPQAPPSQPSLVPPVPPAGRTAGRSGGQPKKRPAKRSRIKVIATLCAGVIVVVIGVTSIGSSGPSVTASVKSFLLDWEDQDYKAAAAMTTGKPVAVAASLSAVYRQLGAQDLQLAMGQINLQGDVAHASFYASFDLGRGGLSWTYLGHFTLRQSGSGWRVLWSPSVIVPGLGARQRLAVLTTLPHRAVLLDTQGHSLIKRSAAYEIGVVPDRVGNPLLTAEKLAKVTGLAQSDADEMSGQIQAWPSRKFLELVQLAPARYRHIRAKLGHVPDIQHRRVIKRLFDSSVPVVTGKVATETARTLIEDGEPYRPGTTIGLSGLEQAYQGKLAGKPTTEGVVQ